jgi:hypothetical protein
MVKTSFGSRAQRAFLFVKREDCFDEFITRKRKARRQDFISRNDMQAEVPDPDRLLAALLGAQGARLGTPKPF